MESYVCSCVSSLQNLLNVLDENVQHHGQLNTKCDDFRDWLNSQRDQLTVCDDVSGEKADIVRRIAAVKVS